MENCFETCNYDDIVQVVDIENLRKNFHIEDETNAFDMTSLGTLLLLEQSTSKISNTDDPLNDEFGLQRLSLAYERLHSIPRIVLEEIAPHVEILDISHNEFDNLDFLKEFRQLTSLICDHNRISNETKIPYLPTLELLWMNHCKISELLPWARILQQSCPDLQYLSLMGNPVAPTYLNGGTTQEYLNYRFFMISLFPKLQHLDDRAVTMSEREEAQKIFYRPLVERIMWKTQQTLPDYLKIATEKVSFMLSPALKSPQVKNVMI